LSSNAKYLAAPQAAIRNYGFFFSRPANAFKKAYTTKKDVFNVAFL